MLTNTAITQLSLYDMAQAIHNQTLSATQIMEACLARIAEREPKVRAWQCINPDAALEQAHQMDRLPIKGILHGLPIGIKDTIETRNFPTERGSSIYANQTTPWDAASVTLIQRAGGIILGKTVTTEFAYFRPGPTANPHNLAHTPGGSSSGSAAAVADYMIPAALGTQTAGSLIRPASYCGVVGYKPTFGDFSLCGVRPVSSSLDTLGVITRTVHDAALMRAVLLNQPFHPLKEERSLPSRIAFCHTPSWLEADSYTRAQLEKIALNLASGNTQVSLIELPTICDDMVSVQKTIMAYEAAQNLSFEYDYHKTQLSPQICELIEDGMLISHEDYLFALATVQKAREQMALFFEKWDAILAPAAPGEAPLGLQATGDPIFSRMWNMLGLPCLTIPAFQGPQNLPIGIQVIGAQGEDEHLLQIALGIEKKLNK